MSEPTATLTEAVLALARKDSNPGVIARQLDCSRRDVTRLLWRLRSRGELPPAPPINPEALPGRILALVTEESPARIPPLMVMNELGCSLADYRRAITKLSEKALVAISAGLLHLPGVAAPLASRLASDPETRQRSIEAAIIRRAFAMDGTGLNLGAVSLLHRAAELSHDPQRTNFLALGDLIGAREGQYRDVSAEEVKREAARQGFANRAMVDQAAREVPA
ncbi:hypothetical protein FG93_01959 [Bosea sp. LC85]|uniref:hypothetical protein n=1 Tax=Bosea sp. LC85 TaxID=1502851 RepID=UPI0004E3559A|nr:hypothetical protein [Bosea sp. LC85]KFC73215.1 hypothetical protein FG93_01959 [Bosea sp. LC85]